MKNLSIFGANFSWIKYVGNDFSFLEKGHTSVYYCWNYGPSNLKAELKESFGVYSRKNCPRHGSARLPPADSYWSSDVVLMFLMLFLKSIDIFSKCFCCYLWTLLFLASTLWAKLHNCNLLSYRNETPPETSLGLFSRAN